jgi:hypothetical protein
MLHGHTPWPASSRALGEFATMRAIGGAGIPKVKADTIQGNLSALRSIHVDRLLDTTVFDNPWLRRIVTGIRRVEPTEARKQAAPITRSILRELTSKVVSSGKIEDLNFDAAAKVAFAGFLRMGEFTVKNSQLRDDPRTFSHTRLTRSDITFSNNDSHAILRLKRSKADTEHRGIDIVLAASTDDICPVKALRELFQRQPLAGDQPLFGFGGGPLRRDWMIATLQKRMGRIRENTSARYTGHSFRRGAAQQASDNGLNDEDIKALGRWNSESFKRYFKQSMQQRFALSCRFLTRSSQI